jgi:flagellar hook-length control protein FliK
MVQASASNIQTINMTPADNSPQGGFAAYDPYRAVELANNVREQATSGASNQLVLDMVSDGIGKVNLKVEAKKGEISVEAVTQSEPARQSLMNHTVELRQDLRNQGLVLGKFMVDVNGGGQGGNSGADTNRNGGSGAGGYPPAGTRTVKTTTNAPVPAAVLTGQSRINVFA